jgi:subtilase family serine protease
VHKFASDGDYTVHLTATTTDGRTGSLSRVIQVRTHDVAITQLATPNSARVDQTIKISVQVQNTRYPETVQVTLSKSIPGGFTQTGSLTQAVPVKKGNKTTLFAFTYTVTSDDQAVGKITFRVDAIITDHRDALPADNELSSTPVKIN